MNKIDEALADYMLATRVNPKYAEVYAAIAIIYNKQSKTKEACDNFEKALRYGLTEAAEKIVEMCDSNSLAVQKFKLKILIDKSTDPGYGYSGENPIKIGKPVGRQRFYLSCLRDSQGNRVKFTRTGNCCKYSSKNGFFGVAMCDVYEVELDGRIKTLYITFYDYEEPKIPLGFYSAKDFEK